MEYVVQIKTCSVSGQKRKAAAEVLGLDDGTLKFWLKYGQEVKGLTGEQAELFYDILSYHGIKSCYSLVKIDQGIKQAHKTHVETEALEKAYKKTTIGKAILFSVLWILFYLSAVIAGSPFWGIWVGIVVVAALTLLVQKLLSFLVVPLTDFVISKVMSKIEIKYNIALSDVVYREIDFYASMSEKIVLLMNANNNQISKNVNDHNRYVYSFFPGKLPIYFLSFVVDQMRTGANYSESCWRAEQAMSQEQWKAEMRKRQEKAAQEEEKWRAQVLESQKREEEYRRQQAQAASAAAYQLEQRNWAIRENTAAYKECRDELKKIRYS